MSAQCFFLATSEPLYSMADSSACASQPPLKRTRVSKAKVVASPVVGKGSLLLSFAMSGQPRSSSEPSPVDISPTVLPDAGTVLLSPMSGSVLPDAGPPDDGTLDGPSDDGNLEFWKRMAKVLVSESDTKEFADLLRQE